jgi:hypothetical protein
VLVSKWAGHWAGKSRHIPACLPVCTADRASYPLKYGKMPGFGLFVVGLISVRSGMAELIRGPIGEVGGSRYARSGWGADQPSRKENGAWRSR